MITAFASWGPAEPAELPSLPQRLVAAELRQYLWRERRWRLRRLCSYPMSHLGIRPQIARSMDDHRIIVPSAAALRVRAQLTRIRCRGVNYAVFSARTLRLFRRTRSQVTHHVGSLKPRCCVDMRCTPAETSALAGQLGKESANSRTANPGTNPLGATPMFARHRARRRRQARAKRRCQRRLRRFRHAAYQTSPFDCSCCLRTARCRPSMSGERARLPASATCLESALGSGERAQMVESAAITGRLHYSAAGCSRPLRPTGM